jgi:hypothetical protein
VFPLRSVVDAMYSDHFRVIGETLASGSLLWPAVAMVLFAAALGPDRRWWPWSLAPVALLLSFAPSLALLVSREGLRDWSMFGVVVPLFILGLVWSSWRPLAARLSIWVDHADAPEAAAARVASRPTGRRRSLVLNAMAVVLLAWSTIAFIGDPLPAQIATSLPTYLGVRTAVEDVRVKMNLRIAIDAMDRHRAETGSYYGFDARTGGALESRLAWTDRRAAAATPMWVWIDEARGDLARVAALSESGNAFCLQRTDEALTFGAAKHSYGTLEGRQALGAAISSCGVMPWTRSAVEEPPWRTMCSDVDPSGGYVLCRMVQVLSVEQLRRTKPDGV